MDLADDMRRYEAWQHTASISALLANINRDPKRKRQPYTVDDFMPVTYPLKKEEPVKPPESWQAVYDRMDSANKEYIKKRR